MILEQVEGRAKREGAAVETPGGPDAVRAGTGSFDYTTLTLSRRCCSAQDDRILVAAVARLFRSRRQVRGL